MVAVGHGFIFWYFRFLWQWILSLWSCGISCYSVCLIHTCIVREPAASIHPEDGGNRFLQKCWFLFPNLCSVTTQKHSTSKYFCIWNAPFCCYEHDRSDMQKKKKNWLYLWNLANLRFLQPCSLEFCFSGRWCHIIGNQLLVDAASRLRRKCLAWNNVWSLLGLDRIFDLFIGFEACVFWCSSIGSWLLSDPTLYLWKTECFVKSLCKYAGVRYHVWSLYWIWNMSCLVHQLYVKLYTKIHYLKQCVNFPNIGHVVSFYMNFNLHGPVIWNNIICRLCLE